MSRLHISDRARSDLDAIWRYSFEQWAQARADDYYLALREKLHQIATAPESGAAVDVRPTCRKILSGSHYIYYRAVPGGVEVLRVLHQSMDVRRHLAP